MVMVEDFLKQEDVCMCVCVYRDNERNSYSSQVKRQI